MKTLKHRTLEGLWIGHVLCRGTFSKPASPQKEVRRYHLPLWSEEGFPKGRLPGHGVQALCTLCKTKPNTQRQRASAEHGVLTAPEKTGCGSGLLPACRIPPTTAFPEGFRKPFLYLGHFSIAFYKCFSLTQALWMC